MYWCMHNWFRVCVLGLQACHLAMLFFEKAMFGLPVNLIMCAKVHVSYMFFLWALGGKVWFPSMYAFWRNVGQYIISMSLNYTLKFLKSLVYMFVQNFIQIHFPWPLKFTDSTIS